MNILIKYKLESKKKIYRDKFHILLYINLIIIIFSLGFFSTKYCAFDLNLFLETMGSSKNSTNWIFTWNGETTEDSPTNLPSVEAMKSFLNKRTKESVFQLERGDEAGRYHYQGRMTLKGGRISKKRLLSEFGELGNVKNLTLSAEEHYDTSAYCTKLETRRAGPWHCGLDSYTQKFERMELDLHLWQEQLLQLINNPHERVRNYMRNRRVISIHDTVGGGGKSMFLKYLRLNQETTGLVVRKLPIGTTDRVTSAIFKATKKENVDVFVFDFTRTLGTDTRKENLFQIVEDLKNGYLVDVMYGSYNEVIMKPPMVIIFSNYHFHELFKYLSADRWLAYNIELVKYGKKKHKTLIPVEVDSLTDPKNTLPTNESHTKKLTNIYINLGILDTIPLLYE